MGGIFSPMLMGDSQSFEHPFKNDEEQYRANEDEGDILLICCLTFECLRKDVDHGISDDGSAG